MKMTEKLIQAHDELFEELDFDSGDVEKLWMAINSKIGRKSPADQVAFLNSLIKKVMSVAKDAPSGETKIRSALKSFRKEMF